MLTASNISKVYKLGTIEVPALKDVSLTIPDRSIVCIMGRSGSGKSTLLRQLSLIDKPTSGQITINGQDVGLLAEKKRAQLRLETLGYIFQEYALIPELTAEENILLPAMMLGQQKPAEYKRQVTELLEVVGLGDRKKHRPKQMSGGEQQRVAIARAMINKPSIIFADEPTANLDSVAAITVMHTLTVLNQNLGVTIVFVSHDPDQHHYANQIIQLADGQVMEVKI